MSYSNLIDPTNLQNKGKNFQKRCNDETQQSYKCPNGQVDQTVDKMEENYEEKDDLADTPKVYKKGKFLI